MANDLANEYRVLAKVCEGIDYADTKSVRATNRAVDGMREIVRRAEDGGAEEVASLVPLLRDPLAGVWIAHHLVELATIDAVTRQACIRKVREAMAKHERAGRPADAMGEEYWLREWDGNADTR